MPTQKPKKTSLSLAAKHKKWLDFLLFVNSKEIKNKELVIEYFFTQFIESPKTFYKFLSFLKKRLRIKKKSIRLQKHIAEKYFDILLPLCDRFGFFEQRNQLNDLCFQIRHPEKYREIVKSLQEYKQNSKTMVQKILKILDAIMKKKRWKYELRGRYKNIYSIHKKMWNKLKTDVFQLKDIFAFRIIIENNSPSQCFELLNLLHDQFTPLPARFKDYISIPKVNGYQSLHTGLQDIIPDLDLPVEIQIRTRKMNKFAEKGLAAHWLYSQEKKARLLTEKEKSSLGITSVYNVEDDKCTYCFSYTGDLFQLKGNPTPLDLAYQIHSHLGDMAQSAVINGKQKPLDYVLKTGDQVKILKSGKRRFSKNRKLPPAVSPQKKLMR